MMKYAPLFAKAAWTTLGIGAAGIFLSFLAGLVISVIRYRKIPFLLPLSTAYVELSRNTPLLVQLFFLYFGLPKAGIHISGETCAAAGLTFLGGSYMAEAVRFSGDGKILDRRAAPQPEGLSNFFYGGFHVRPNGNFTVANWTGHSGRDFRPGWKLIEFTPAGAVAWTWNAPWAGTPAAVIVFD